ncbi:hypothetical protein BDK51DRAFT_20286 [Blyttiomyces helicus]|uniref:FAD-binding PCMH-type domain-containing protein n=1 Tax=Blyttiomyces helicus TaxID=388810 RepID=A0A4P9WKX3_9FUNG|nr:hypothetical protein BDK51DRAFT_20286 [Blyttiomyces helicus]|eukprot:RKO93659.1 hypothetical protein BDK51DRAFT_20286 [Blyttiomyces helicus]
MAKLSSAPPQASDETVINPAVTVTQLVAEIDVIVPTDHRAALTPDQYADSYAAWKTQASGEYDAIVAALRDELDARFPSPQTITILDVGAGPASVAARLPARIRDRIVRFTACEPHPAFAASLESGLSNAFPRAEQTIVDLRTFSADYLSSCTWDVILLSHSLYGIADKPRAVRDALAALAPGGVVLILYQLSASADRLCTQLGPDTAVLRPIRIPATTVPDRDHNLDLALWFLCGYIPLGSAAAKARDAFRRLAGRPPRLDAPNALITVTPPWLRLLEQVPPAPTDYVVKDRHARGLHPACIVRPANEIDVQTCVRWAVANGTQLTTVGGGHSGHCVRDGVVAVDMSALRDVVVDRGALTVTVGAGATGGLIVREAHAAGLAVPFGARPSVGAGLWLQGGVGHLTRLFGLTCDRIIAVRVVELTAEAPLRALSGPANLWQFCGAGTNFGVVVQVTFQAEPFGDIAVRHWDISFGPDSSGHEDAIGRYADLASRLKSCAANLYLFRPAADVFKVAITASDTSPDADESARLAAALNDGIASPPPAKRFNLLEMFDQDLYMTDAMRPDRIAGEPPGLIDSFKRSLLLSSAALQANRSMLQSALASSPSKLDYIHMVHAGSPVVRHPPGGQNAFACREWDWVVVITGVWPRSQPARRDAVLSWVYAATYALLPFCAGVYSVDLGPDRRDVPLAARAFDDALPVLAHLKRTSADPHGVLPFACPIVAADAMQRRGAPAIVVIVTGLSGAGKDFAAGIWRDVLTDHLGGEARTAVEVISISDETKRAYAASDPTINLGQLLTNREYKEHHRPALTAFFHAQKHQTPNLELTHFLNVVNNTGAHTDILIITGMREHNPKSRYAGLVRCPLLHIIVTRESAAEAEGPASDDVDLRFTNDAPGPHAARLWADTTLLPRLLPLLTPLDTPTDPRIIDLLGLIASTPDYPRKGVTFRHVLGVVEREGGLELAVSLLAERVERLKPFDALVCCEAGGFLLASGVALRIRWARLVIARRSGKLPPGPAGLLRASYRGSNVGVGEGFLEMGADALKAGDRVLMVDDVLATGATLAAVVSLVKQCGASVVGAVVVAEFPWHRGRDAVHPDVRIDSLVAFPGE